MTNLWWRIVAEGKKNRQSRRSRTAEKEITVKKTSRVPMLRRGAPIHREDVAQPSLAMENEGTSAKNDRTAVGNNREPPERS